MQRALLVDLLAAVLPTPRDDCPFCDPSGGCATPTECRRQLAEQALALIERETANSRGHHYDILQR